MKIYFVERRRTLRGTTREKKGKLEKVAFQLRERESEFY
jgi:hypothetical protein